MSKCCSIGIGVALAAAASLCLTAPGYADCGEQLAKLVPDDGGSYDIFGVSVSVFGNVAVIGASGDDENGNVSGSAYVFRWDGAEWLREDKLLPDDGAPGDRFGNSVSVSGNVALIGAISDLDNGPFSGSAYVFRWDGAEWRQEQKLLPDDGAPFDRFGNSVSVSGDVAVIGARGDHENAIGSGSAYVFRWDGTDWRPLQKLRPDDGADGDLFGQSVSVAGDVAIIGASGDDDNGANSGSAYVFCWDGAEWRQQRKLLPDDGTAGDLFGRSVSVAGDMAIIGASEDDENGTDSGSAYVFGRDGAGWRQERKLLPEDGTDGELFGRTVSVSSEMAVIGAGSDRNNGGNSGSAYVFLREGAEWFQQQKLLPEDGAFHDYFGVSVSASGNVAVVGAQVDDNSGSAYVFDVGGCGACVRDPEWQCDGDTDGDGQVNPVDSGVVQANFGNANEQALCNYDLDCDGQINPVDSGIVQALFGTCEPVREVCP